MRHEKTNRASLRQTQAESLRTELKTEMGELRTELKTEMGELRTELKTEMGELRTDLRAEMGGLSAHFEERLGVELRTMTWRMVTALISTMVAMTALVVSAPHI